MKQAMVTMLFITAAVILGFLAWRFTEDMRNEAVNAGDTAGEVAVQSLMPQGDW